MSNEEGDAEPRIMLRCAARGALFSGSDVIGAILAWRELNRWNRRPDDNYTAELGFPLLPHFLLVWAQIFASVSNNPNQSSRDETCGLPGTKMKNKDFRGSNNKHGWVVAIRIGIFKPDFIKDHYTLNQNELFFFSASHTYSSTHRLLPLFTCGEAISDERRRSTSRFSPSSPSPSPSPSAILKFLILGFLIQTGHCLVRLCQLAVA